jgi:response regulator RpfG family c-di-GMP phosphodiesterase
MLARYLKFHFVRAANSGSFLADFGSDLMSKLFEQKIINMSDTDSRIRIILAVIFTVAAVYTGSYWLLIPVFLLQLTAFTGHRYVYDLLGINPHLVKHNEMLSLLPRYNPSPVIIFDDQGQRVFANQPAQKELKDIESIDEIDDEIPKNIKQIIATDGQRTLIFKTDHATYLITLVGVASENLLMTYSKDISEAVKTSEEIIHTQKEIVYRMGEIAETRSKETGQHVKRVAEYSGLIAHKLGLPDDEVNLIKMASPMHDIGKVGIPDTILNKPDKLDPEEWKTMQAHTTIGYNLLKHSERPILKTSAIIARDHHEKFDGSGYPNGVAGENIHIYARITAVADVFDALGSDRVYKKAWAMDKIIALFEEQRGKHFDPQLTDILLNNLDDFIGIRDRYTDEI